MRGQLNTRSNMNRSWESVVGTLPHVHVIVWMNRFFRSKPVAASDLYRSITDHFVDVHVAGSSGTRLEHVDRKLAVQFAIDHVLASVEHRFNLRIVQRIFAGAAQFVQIAVRDPASQFDSPHRSDHRRRHLPA